MKKRTELELLGELAGRHNAYKKEVVVLSKNQHIYREMYKSGDPRLVIYFLNGERHREDGPAWQMFSLPQIIPNKIWTDTEQTYWLYGRELIYMQEYVRMLTRTENKNEELARIISKAKNPAGTALILTNMFKANLDPKVVRSFPVLAALLP